jgi:hypothetical protein
MTESPGMIFTQDTSCASSINIHLLKHVPWYQEYYNNCQANWELPDGQWICDSLQFWQKCNQLSVGYFHTYKETPNPHVVEAKREWFRDLRYFITHNKQGIDTEGTALAHFEKTGDLPNSWCHYQDMIALHGEPESITYWYDESVVNFVMDQTEGEPWLIWVDSIDLGKKFAEKGLHYFGAGMHGDLLSYVSRAEIPQKPIVLSIDAHGTGKELQKFNKNFVVTPPASGDVTEQLIGRTHRERQWADEITFVVLQHSKTFRENFEKAEREACYIQTTTNQQQKLLLATKVWV